MGLKTVVLLGLLFSIAPSAFAVTVEIEKYDSAANYSVLSATNNIVYLNKCNRDKLKPYEWKTWEGHYGVRAYIQPIATIIVKRELNDAYIVETSTFVEKAIQISAKIGGNILCYVDLKKWSQTVSYEAMTFRAYRQFFLSGHKGLETFYNDKMTGGLPLTIQDTQN